MQWQTVTHKHARRAQRPEASSHGQAAQGAQTTQVAPVAEAAQAAQAPAAKADDFSRFASPNRFAPLASMALLDREAPAAAAELRLAHALAERGVPLQVIQLVIQGAEQKAIAAGRDLMVDTSAIEALATRSPGLHLDPAVLDKVATAEPPKTDPVLHQDDQVEPRCGGAIAPSADGLPWGRITAAVAAILAVVAGVTFAVRRGR